MTQTVDTIDTLKRFVVAPTMTQEAVTSKITEYDRQLEVLKKIGRKSQFAFENTPEQIEEKKQLIIEDRLHIEREQNRLKLAKLGYPQELDYSPLGWLKKNTLLPAFYIVNIKHSSVTLRVHISRGSLVSFGLQGQNQYDSAIDYPAAIRILYRDAANKITEKDNSGKSTRVFVTATAKFQGILPESTRSKINTAIKSRLFNEIFIISEANKWDINTITVTKGDPIVVGWIEKTSQMFIVDVFDPTPLEDYLVMSHTI